MRRHLLTLVIALVLPAIATGIELKSAPIGGDDSNEGATYSFINFGRKRLVLPVRTSVTGYVHNRQKTVWAVNYHETSDYDGVDLLIESGGEVFISENLWQTIEDDVVQAGVIPSTPLDRVHFEVVSIETNELMCHVLAQPVQGEQQTIDTSFKLRCEVKAHRPDFSIEK